jgi:hypothetical protein
MFDIETTVTESLRDRADRERIGDSLLTGVPARAASLRRRRRLLRVTAGAGLVGVLAGAALMVPRLLPGSGPGTSGVGAPGPAVVAPPVPASTGSTALPEVVGAPAAAARPALVGSDPSVVHFDVNLDALDMTTSEWTSAAGYESMTKPASVPRNGRPLFAFFLGPDQQRLIDAAGIDEAWDAAADRVTVRGRPGELRSGIVDEDTWGDMSRPGVDERIFILSWQPVDGLHVIVVVRDGQRSSVFTGADALRLDRVQRCVMPFRFLHVPAGSQWTACSTAVRTSPVKGSVWIHSSVTVRQSDGDRMNAYLEEQSLRVGHDLDKYGPTMTINGHRAAWVTANPRGLWALNVGPTEVFIGGETDRDAARIRKSEAVAFFTDLRIVGDLGHPSTWPRRAIG